VNADHAARLASLTTAHLADACIRVDVFLEAIGEHTVREHPAREHLRIVGGAIEE